MLRIDNTLLQEVGLGTLPDSEKNSLLKHIYETLEMRVGVRLADQMTNEQLDEFERYFEAKDDAGAFKWLETNFPNYKDIVQEEFDKLKAEVTQSAPQILTTSQATSAQQQGSLPTAQPPEAANQQPQKANTPTPPVPEQHQSEVNPSPQASNESDSNPITQDTEDNTEPGNLPPYPSEQPPAGPSAS